MDVAEGSGVEGGESSGGGVGDTERVARTGGLWERQKDEVLLLTAGTRPDSFGMTIDGPAAGWLWASASGLRTGSARSVRC